MEPLSITSLVGTCFSLLAVVAKTIKSLHDLRSNFREVDSDLRHLFSRISTVQTSVQTLQRWLDTGPATLQNNHQLMTALEQSLGDCIVVVSAIEKHLSRINFSVSSGTAAKARLKHLWKAEEVSKHERTLGYQIQALMLLLHSMQMTVLDQQKLMAKDDNQKLFKRARDDASSYIDLTDEHLSVLQGSMATAGQGMETAFEFDDLALDSHAYRAAFRLLLKKDRKSGLGTIAVDRQDPLGREGAVGETTATHRPPPPKGNNEARRRVTAPIKGFPSLQYLHYVTQAVYLFHVGFGMVGENTIHEAPPGMWRIEIKNAQDTQSPGFIDKNPNLFIRIKTNGIEAADTWIQRSNRNPAYN
ncbi:hypothetical protein QBC38DRAFT_460922 [Podospora fimiseda]|uniref:Fungal N-terminal domain-containing protein n=1 Tax=Podospora fimiseda TaxID=252190 RepID=A0AAN6YP67_9PEZI|nr:hypothetical protein QBC38DRAFT_460922 [Podospora fimiseda]